MSRGSFKCAPTVCKACGDAALRISMHTTKWGKESEGLPEPTRECVREFLRGLRARQVASDDAKEEAARAAKQAAMARRQEAAAARREEAMQQARVQLYGR